MPTNQAYQLKGNINQVKNILTDLVYYGKLHPLIISVQKIENESQDAVDYKIKERPYSWLPITIQYAAQVSSSENQIEYKITDIPFTKANITYQIKEVSEKETEALFTLQLNSMWGVKSILRSKMMAAQNELIVALNEELSKE